MGLNINKSLSAFYRQDLGPNQSKNSLPIKVLFSKLLLNTSSWACSTVFSVIPYFTLTADVVLTAVIQRHKNIHVYILSFFISIILLSDTFPIFLHNNIRYKIYILPNQKIKNFLKLYSFYPAFMLSFIIISNEKECIIMVNKDSLNMSGYGLEDLCIGQKGTITKTISEHDVYTYAGIIGDFNPLHVNAEYAKTTRFGERIAHGMLTASFFSTVLGMILPGTGGIYLGQNVRFVRPVKIGDTITAEGVITEINKEKRIITVETTAYNQNGDAVVTGEAKMMVTI